jgi:hypothetical protein
VDIVLNTPYNKRGVVLKCGGILALEAVAWKWASSNPCIDSTQSIGKWPCTTHIRMMWEWEFQPIMHSLSLLVVQQKPKLLNNKWSI